MELFSDKRLSVTRKHGGLFALALGIFLTLDWAVMDRWQIHGQATDEYGQAIPYAWVLAEFTGEKPLLNPPIPPHPNHRSTYCMGARLTQADAKGRFAFDEWTLNRASANKRAYLHVFKPDWISDARSLPISASVVGSSPSARLLLQRGPGEDIKPIVSHWSSSEIELGSDQLRTTRELFAATRQIVNQSCGYAGIELAIIAMNHALSIASTYDERDRVRGACRYMSQYSTTVLPTLVSTAEKLTSGYRKRDWPFDCDNLQFKNPVPPEVLRVEAEIAAQRSGHGTPTQQGS